ncbi:MAG TPA: ribonuclease P protein component [Sphingomonadales bacterium]|nr:ribonuclease P protein component [Sphingomonadales bacterium]
MPESRPVQRLVCRADFLRIAKAGARASAPALALQGMANRDGGSTVFLGFTVSRKVGTAVTRNRVKRRLREAARAVFPRLARPGTSYVVIGRRAALTRPFADVKADLESALDALHRKLK